MAQKALSFKFQHLNELVKRDLVRGLPKVLFTPDGLSDSCQKCKQIRTSHKSKAESVIDKVFHMLHLDLFGTSQYHVNQQEKVHIVIVDEYTRFTWVYFLHKEDETSAILLDHVRLIETDEFKVKILRSDNGTEFKNSAMEDFCKYKGISQQFSAPGTPQQNE